LKYAQNATDAPSRARNRPTVVFTGDASMDGGGAVGGPGTPLAFTNLPYIPDAGVTAAPGWSTPATSWMA
jgi:hypothetical protein